MRLHSGARVEALNIPALNGETYIEDVLKKGVPEPWPAYRVLACTGALEALVVLLRWRSEVPGRLPAAHCPLML